MTSSTAWLASGPSGWRRSGAWLGAVRPWPPRGGRPGERGGNLQRETGGGWGVGGGRGGGARVRKVKFGNATGETDGIEDSQVVGSIGHGAGIDRHGGAGCGRAQD